MIKRMLVVMSSLMVISACGPATQLADLLSADSHTPSSTATNKARPTRTPTPLHTSTPQPTATYSPHHIGPDNFPNVVNPLTGLTVSDPARINHRPVSVKITNYPRTSRPQWGLSLADLVFEYYHNNDLTRFHAIFYSNDASTVGPIRSARLFDDYLVRMYKSDFVFASADSRILEYLNDQDYAERLIYYLSGACPPYPVCRYNPAGDNFLITDTRQARRYLKREHGVKDPRQNLNGMTFSPLIPEDGQSIDRIYVRYSYAAYLYWQFEPQSGRYFRYQDTREDILGSGEGYAPLIDRLSGEHIAADNIVVLTVSHCHAIYKPPEDGRAAIEIVDMDLVGSGVAYAFRDGQAYEIDWIRPENDWVLQFIRRDGSPYYLKPGTTWFQVITDDSSLSSDGSRVRFDFFQELPPRMCTFKLPQ